MASRKPTRQDRHVTRSPVLFVHAPGRGRAFVRRWSGQRSLFCCILAHTDTCLRPGISAAGIREDLRAFTPAADAEVVLTGRPNCLLALPSNPLGVPGPAAITRAALRLADIEACFVAAGLRVWPDVAVRRVACAPGGSVETGRAVPEARELFETGCCLGHELAAERRHVVVGESVPGGTTTALALLLALGLRADGRVSGSMPGNAHRLKSRLARAGLAASGLEPGDGRADPLGAAACVGDPMQPLAAGIAAGASAAGAEVLLAGGSQMVAVAALLAALGGQAALERLAIGTTRWITADPAADVAGLTAELSPRLPLLAINLDFCRSRHAALQRYEQFLVKEGVGAGGACLAAVWSAAASIEDLQAAIDRAYADVLA